MSINFQVCTGSYYLNGDGTTDKALEELRYLVKEKFINPANFTKATLRYNAHRGLGNEGTEEFYPLKFENDGKGEVWVSSVTAGYRGAGPRGTLEALKLMGFTVDEEMEKVILEKKITNEVFTK